jgi:hypothetical protein
MAFSLFNKKQAPAVTSDGLTPLPTTEVTSSSSEFTIQDLLAPQYYEMDFNHVIVNKRYYRILMITDFPRIVRSTWLSPLVNFESSLAISTFYYLVDSDEVIDKLKRKIA